MVVLKRVLDCSIVLLAILVHLDIIGHDIVLACRRFQALGIFNVLVRGVVDISVIVHVLKV